MITLFENFEFNQKNIFTICSVILVLFVVISLIMNFLSPEKTGIKSKPDIYIKPSLEQIDKIHDALGRGYWIDQSCYDEKTDVWLIHIPLRPKLQEGWSYTNQKDPSGWFFNNNKDLTFMKFGNDTLSILSNEDFFKELVFPDVTGLNCKIHVPDPVENTE